MQLHRIRAVAACATVLIPLALAAPADARFGERTLRPGHSGPDVRTLQSYLTRAGYETRVSGTYDAATERRVRRFEDAEGRRPNGIVSVEEARLLRARVRAAGPRATSSRSRSRRYRFGQRTLRTGSVGHDVRVLQSWLTKVGFPTGVDGVFGRRTRWNVRRFERREERRVNGILSRSDGRVLRLRMREAVASGETAQPRADGGVGEHVFPVRGRHDYGGAGARFGADRGGRLHRGQDVFAACGTPLVAAQGGTVEYAGWHDAAGHYVVITGAQSGEDYVYMHMTQRATLRAGDRVATGQQIGTVGESGNARGCHLHFELWTAPGWYKGGDPYDPLPRLRAWDAAD